MSENFVFVAREESGEPKKCPLREDKTVPLSTLRSHFERLIGLKYRIRDENFTWAVRATESGFHPPQDGWGQRIYWCIFSEEDRNNKRKCDATTSVSSVAKAKKNNRQEITPETLSNFKSFSLEKYYKTTYNWFLFFLFFSIVFSWCDWSDRSFRSCNANHVKQPTWTRGSVHINIIPYNDICYSFIKNRI